MKRKGDEIVNPTPAKKAKVDTNQPPIFPEKLISATSLANHILGDPLIDWLNLYYDYDYDGTKDTRDDRFLTFLKQKGLNFENTIVSFIHKNKVPVVKVSEDGTFSFEAVEKTKKLMKENTPILWSAPLYNPTDNTGGVADLIIRNDVLNLFITTPYIESLPPTFQSGKVVFSPTFYVVVEIKNSILPLRADGKYLLNTDRYPAYKSQLLIYNRCLGLIQGYTHGQAYVIGHGWNYTEKGMTFSGDECLTRMGVVDFDGVDRSVIEKTDVAVAWIKELRRDGKAWKISPPSRDELYPNMSNHNNPEWENVKRNLADEIGEISLLWYCGVKQRLIAKNNGFTSWKEPGFTAKSCGVIKHAEKTVDEMVRINTNSDVSDVSPEKITFDKFEWRSQNSDEIALSGAVRNLEVFVDFETISTRFLRDESNPDEILFYSSTLNAQSSFKESKSNQFIYMIGVWYFNHETGEWSYKNFTCSEITREEEFKIMDEFQHFLRMNFTENPLKLYYWCAERNLWRDAEKIQFDLLETERIAFNGEGGGDAIQRKEIEEKQRLLISEWNFGEWCDLHQLFKSEPVVIRGCFRYGLKEVATALKNLNLLPPSHKERFPHHPEPFRRRSWQELREEEENFKINSGKEAMIVAAEYYLSKRKENLEELSKYNKMDCMILREILTYIRSNHA